MNYRGQLTKGLSVVGMKLQSGKSCTYFADQVSITFYVNEDSDGCRISENSFEIQIFGHPVPVKVNYICTDQDITGDDINIKGDNPFNPNFLASKNLNGSWTIDKVP